MGRGAGRSAPGAPEAGGDPWRTGRFSLSGSAPLPRRQLVEIQRSRLLAGAVAAIDELGYTRTTVTQITARAGVSRRTFYEVFGDQEACLIALLDDAIALVEEEIRMEVPRGAGWRERVRGGLGAILAFFDREPALARVCVVQALRGGPKVLERRELALARLAETIDAGRGERARAAKCTPVTAEGLVGAVFGIIYTRLLRSEPRPLRELEGELMSMIVLPYMGPAAATRELMRPARAPAPAASRARTRRQGDRDPLLDAPVRLTLCTARVLDCIAELPGVCNREVAERAEIADAGQTSKLLRRLARLGLIENTSEGHSRGAPNAWSLTQSGQRVAQSIRAHARQDPRGRAA
jgi:AcrR family transcriptional regulator/DNA-binding MarR family transcriptional regulator